MSEDKVYNLVWASPFAKDAMESIIRGVSKKIEARTDGKIIVSIYDGERPEGFDLLEEIQAGHIDMGFTMSALGGKSIGLHHCEAGQIPGWPSGKAGCAFVKAVMEKYVKPEMAERNLIPIVYQINACDDFGYYTLQYATQMWCVKHYDSLDEAKGAKVFCQHAVTADTFRRLGFEPVMCSYTDIFRLMEAGELDAAVLSVASPLGLNIQNIVKTCLKVDYPQSEDNFTIMNLEKYNELPESLREILIDEFRNIEMLLDRLPMNFKAWDMWHGLEKAGKINIVEMTGAQKDLLKKAFLEDVGPAWVEHQKAAGFAAAGEYLEELNAIKAEVLASGLPQYLGPRN